ncbi:mucin-17-like [Biomphalaria glabrata]|uniref:Mucin-17-like n=1 Tax=Biomphalaria glabrata TaxID=6526 RepID=A0A9W2Z856_BIOGL|nr:mucin-17-like [Biomphalaria glabrata]
MPRRKTTLSDSSPPAPNQCDDTKPDSVRASDRPSKRRKTSVGSNPDNGSGDLSVMADIEKKPGQTWSCGSAQPTSKKASILSRAATTSSSSTPPQQPTTAAPLQTQHTHGATSGSDTLVVATSQQELVPQTFTSITAVQASTTTATPVLLRQLETQSILQTDEQRAQSSSAPPKLVSDPESGGQRDSLQDRRSIHSLEALFKVTDSELQNMRADTPVITSPAHVSVPDQTQSYIVLNDLSMTQGEGPQIFIAPTEITGDTETGGGSYYIIPSNSTTLLAQAATFSLSGSQEDDMKLMLKSDSQSGLLEYPTLSCAPQTYTVLSEQGDKEASNPLIKMSTTTPGRKRIHPQKPGKYKCKYCDRTCAKPSVLEKHLRAHTNERPFPCVVCGVSFKTKSNLSKHCKSNAHVSRTGLSWAGSRENVSHELRDSEARDADEENDSEGTETDVEGPSYVDNDDDSGEESQKVIVVKSDSLLTDTPSTSKPEQLVRQGNIREEIRPKLDSNKKQPEQQEAKIDLGNWFTRLFNAFDKPSESELAKYDEAQSLIKPNILSMDNLKNAEEILSELQSLRNEYNQNYPATMPVLMTYAFQPDNNNMLVKILKPKAEFLPESYRQVTSIASQSHSQNVNISKEVSCSGCIMSMTPIPAVQSTLGRPMSNSSILQSKLKSASLSEVENCQSSTKLSLHSKPQLSESNDGIHPVESLPQQRSKLVSNQSDDLSTRTLQHPLGKYNSLPSVEESHVNRQRQSTTEGDVNKKLPSSSRHPALGESNTAAFSILTQSEKPTLVYQHALDSESDKSYKSQARSLSASLTTDTVKDRIDNIISSNAEIIDKHSVTEPPRQRNKHYHRQTSDSSFQSMKISDLRPSSEVTLDRLKVEMTDKLWKKKLAPSLSMGDTDGSRLKPDFVKRSMSTSALRKADSAETDMRVVNSQIITTSNLHMTGVIQPVTSAQITELLLLQHETNQQLQELQQKQQQFSSNEFSHTVKVSSENERLGSVSSPMHTHVTANKNPVNENLVFSQASTHLQPSLNPLLKDKSFSVAHSEDKSKVVYVPFITHQTSSGESSLKVKSTVEESENKLSRKPSSPNIGGTYRFTSEEDSRRTILQNEGSKSYSVSSLSSGSPSGGRVTIQETQLPVNPKLNSNVPTLNQSIPGVPMNQSVPQTLPAKIVPGPGPHEIQIQFQLSSKVQSSTVTTQSTTVPLPVSAPVYKNSSESSSIISSMLQAPRQASPMIGQPGVQFPPTTKTSSPLLTSKSLSGITNSSKKVSAASLVQTGSLDSIGNELATTSQQKPASYSSLHDQKKLMSRQGPSPVSGKPSFMSELQHRLSVPHSESQTYQEWTKKDTLARPLPSDQMAITFEHFKSQGLSDGLAAAAGAYVMTGGMFTCEDCNETFNQLSLLNQHKIQNCPKSKSLRRSLSAIEPASSVGPNSSSPSLASAGVDQHSVDIDSQLLKKSNPALLKSLSTNDLQEGQQSNIKDMPKLREQLVSSPRTTPPAQTSASFPLDSKQNQQQLMQTTLTIENMNPSSLPRKKGRPKGSKNRPKDLNLVLAKARGVQSPAILPGMRQPSSSLDSAVQKDSPLPSSHSQVLLLQGAPYQKLLLPRSTALSKSMASTDISSTPAQPTTPGGQIMNTAANTMINTSSTMIAQPMVPIISACMGQSSPLVSNSKASFMTTSSKPTIPMISGVSSLATTCTNSMSIITPGTPISALAPSLGALNCGVSKPGNIMISFSALTPSTPLTPVTPVTPTNLLAARGMRPQGLEPSVSGISKVSSTGLTLNISSAQSVNSAQFSQMSPRVIPYIPAVTFHNLDPKQGAGPLSLSSPLADQKTQAFRLSQQVSLPSTLSGSSMPSTPLTPATPDTPTDLSGTRRKLKDKLLLKQSLSIEKGQEKSMSIDSPAVLMKSCVDSPSVTTIPPSLLFYSHTSKPTLQTSNSVLLASLTKPVISSQKLGSQPNAVITSAVMGKLKDAEKSSESFYRSESEVLGNQESSKSHPPVMRAFSEPAAAKRLKKSKQVKPSPLSIEEKVVSQRSCSSSKSPVSEEVSSKRSWRHFTESGSDSVDSGLSLRSVSQELPFFLPKSSSIASLDSNELMIDLSGDNFNNVTIPINYSIPFVNISRIQSSPLFTEWNNPNRLTGLQVNLSPLTLVGSKIILPAVGGLSLMQKESKNWLLKRSISLHQHFQILARLRQSSSPLTLDSMTAMALAQGNPSPALLARMLLTHTPSQSENSGAESKMKQLKDESVSSDQNSPVQIKSRLLASPSKGSTDSMTTDTSPHRQVMTPIKTVVAALSVSLSSPSLLSSVEQHISNVTPSGTLHTPMYGHSCPTLYTTTHVTFCCIQRPQPMYVAVKGSKRVSMYSNWCLATHNPNPAGLTSRMLLALYKSRSANNPVYAQCSMTPSNGGNQTHSSYWTYQRKKMGVVKKELLGSVKSEDAKKGDLGSSKESKRHKLRLSKGGFKSNESYEYIRGRGWGKYICEICGIRCKKPSMLKKHLRTHTDVRPYHCQHCHFSFKTKGNLTKHMKSKSHSKKCSELGISPIPTSVDDSQIDSVALAEQCRISREARIHDSTEGANVSGDDEDEDDGDSDEDDEDEEEDEGVSREDTEDHSFDQERSGLWSPRVLKRQSSVDEASPVFSFVQGQKSRPSCGPTGSKSKSRELSESSSVQSSMDHHQNFYPHNIDTEIARSLLDLSQPRRSESKEIVDEEARSHALSHLQTLIAQLMSQKKPLSGLNLDAEQMLAPDSGRLLLNQSLLQPDDSQPLKNQLLLTQLSTSSEQEDKQASQLKKSDVVAPLKLGAHGTDEREVSEVGHQPQGHNIMGELFVTTDDRSRSNEGSAPVSRSNSLQTSSSPSFPLRPNQLSLLKSPTKLQHTNLPSPSLVSFLPAYAQKGRMSHTADQGPIIGQFVRKDHHTISTSNVALTPNLVLAGQSQPFHFNIPFPGHGSGSFSDSDMCTPSPSVTATKPFTHTIPIVTITDTTKETNSPSVEYPVVSSAAQSLQASTTLVSTQVSTSKASHVKSSPVSVSSISTLYGTTVVKSSSIRPTLETQGRSSSESATVSPKLRGGAIQSLIRETALPILLVTGSEDSKDHAEKSDRPKASTLGQLSETPVKRSRHLSFGKSRCLRRQRSLADDTAFPSMDQDSVFESSRNTLETAIDVTMSERKEEKDGGSVTGAEVDRKTETLPETKPEELKKDLDKTVEEKNKCQSCTFCSETFHSAEDFNVHLRSRKHIGILESNGMLPSGTFEKLQQSEKLSIEEKISRTDNEVKILTDQENKEELVSEVMEPLAITTIQAVNSEISKTTEVPSHIVQDNQEMKTELSSEAPLLRRAYSLQEEFLPTTGLLSSQLRGQRPLYKRKISHTAVTESATVLITPHLNESLRQSLVKRARFGLSASKEMDKETGLVNNEQTQCDTVSPVFQATSTMSTSVTTHTPSIVLSSVSCTLTPTVSSVMTSAVMSLVTLPSVMTSSVRSVMTPRVSPVPILPSPFTSTVPSSTAAGLPRMTGMTAMTPDGSILVTANPFTITKSISHSSSPIVKSATLSTSSAPLTSGELQDGNTPKQSVMSYSSSIVDGSMQYHCALCDLTFNSTQLLKNHLVSHADIRPYVCEFCDAGFTNIQSLRTHLLTHTQDRPYICGNCGDTFALQGDLLIHFSSHSSTSIRKHQNMAQDIKTTLQSVSLAPHLDTSIGPAVFFVNQQNPPISNTGGTVMQKVANTGYYPGISGLQESSPKKEFEGDRQLVNANMSDVVRNTKNSLSPDVSKLSTSQSSPQQLQVDSETVVRGRPQSLPSVYMSEQVNNMKTSYSPDVSKLTSDTYMSSGFRESSPKLEYESLSESLVNETSRSSPRHPSTNYLQPVRETKSLEMMETDFKEEIVSASESSSDNRLSVGDVAAAKEGNVEMAHMVVDHSLSTQVSPSKGQQQETQQKNVEVPNLYHNQTSHIFHHQTFAQNQMQVSQATHPQVSQATHQQVSQATHQLSQPSHSEHYLHQHSQQVMFHQPHSNQRQAMQQTDPQQLQHSQYVMLDDQNYTMHSTQEHNVSSAGSSGGSTYDMSHVNSQHMDPCWGQDSGQLEMSNQFSTPTYQSLGQESTGDLQSNFGQSVEMYGSQFDQQTYPYPPEPIHPGDIDESIECNNQYEDQNNQGYRNNDENQSQHPETEANLLPQTYLELS